MGLMKQTLKKKKQSKQLKKGKVYRLIKAVMFYATKIKRETPEPFSFVVTYVYTMNPAKYGDSKFDFNLKKMMRFLTANPENLLIPAMKKQIKYAIEGVEVEEVASIEQKEVSNEIIDNQFQFTEKKVGLDQMRNYILFYTHGGEKTFEYNHGALKGRLSNIHLNPVDVRMSMRQYMQRLFRDRPLTKAEQSSLEKLGKLKRGKP